jgi:chromosome segregation ATPase
MSDELSPEETALAALERAIQKADGATGYHLREAERLAVEHEKLKEKVERATRALDEAKAALKANPANEKQARADAAAAEARGVELRTQLPAARAAFLGVLSGGSLAAAAGAAFDATVTTTPAPPVED